MKRKIGLLAGLIVIISILIYVFIHYFFPEFYPQWYWIIPLFYLLNVCLLYMLLSKKKENPFSMYRHVISKVVKLLGAILIIILYLIFIKTNSISFVCISFFFYIMYTVFETNIFLSQNKKNNENAKE